ncbi:MAG: hypothetical protein ACOCRX_10270 [Candidatus Woesearchaeota archaeon]
MLVIVLVMTFVIGMTGMVFAEGQADDPTAKAQEVLDKDGEAELINNIDDEGLDNKNVHIQNTVSDPGEPEVGE